DLEGLRRRIDEIDDRLQDLLVERIQIVSTVAAHKRNNHGVAAHQPAREAEIIRRLIERNGDALPPATLVRMWRELLAATVRLQGAFTVAVYAPAAAQGFWDIARDHYGSHTPMLPYRTTSQVISAVTDGQAAVGVLPMPQEDDRDPWWRHLLSTDHNAPHVIARLPFGSRGNARPDSGDALAIGRGAEQETGRDRTLIATENAPSISRNRIVSPYTGGEAKAEGFDRPIRLASNESALGPSPKAMAAYRALAGEIHRYPDGSAAELREALGRHHELDPERIVCGAGSDELIGLLLRAYAGPGDEV